MNLDFLKDELKSNVADFVKTEAKEASVFWLRDKALPELREIGEAYTAALKESSERETGWCKFRDRVFLPGAVELAFWLIEKAMEGMAEKQKTSTNLL